MKKVYICSPCRGDYENNIQRAKEYSRAAAMKGCIPIAPHVYLTQFMDDNVPGERELALRMGRELVLMCAELWAFGLDHPSAGMAAEIEVAKQAADLEAHHKLGAITFVLVSFGLRAFYRVPWPVWRDMAETYGRKYIKQEELKQYEVPAVAGYIKLLENLPPETITIGHIGKDEINRIRQAIDDNPGILLPGEGAAP